MAPFNIDLNKEVSFGRKSRGKIPTKTSINLVIKRESLIKTRKGLLGVIIGAVIVLLLVALLIVRPIVGLAAEKAKVADLKSQLDTVNKQITNLADVEEEYAHYTYAGMTGEELDRVDRVQIMSLVKDALIKGGRARKWTLSSNIMALEVTGTSLAELNQIAAALEQEPIVERCVINTANKGGNDTSNVAVSFVIYLQKSPEEQASINESAAIDNGEINTEENAETEEVSGDAD